MQQGPIHSFVIFQEIVFQFLLIFIVFTVFICLFSISIENLSLPKMLVTTLLHSHADLYMNYYHFTYLKGLDFI